MDLSNWKLYDLSFSFILHYMLSYIYVTMIYKFNWFTMKVHKWKHQITIFGMVVYLCECSYDYLQCSNIQHDILATLYELMLSIYRYYNVWIFMNIADNYVDILVSTRWIFFNELFTQHSMFDYLNESTINITTVPIIYQL